MEPVTPSIEMASTEPEAPSFADELAEDLDEVTDEQRQSAQLRAATQELPADRFIDREASWLDFNSRVLDLACDERVPLLERVRFLAIFSSNLDEFYMVRVAGLRRRLATGIAVRAPSGLSPREQLELVLERTRQLVARQVQVFDDIQPALAEEGIRVLRWDDIDHDDRKPLHELFRDRVFPVLTPLAVDPAHPFPYISGLSLNLAVVVRD